MTKEEKNEKCKNCHSRRYYALIYDVHFDWVNCPYKCEAIKEEVNGKLEARLKGQQLIVSLLDLKEKANALNKASDDPEDKCCYLKAENSFDEMIKFIQGVTE